MDKSDVANPLRAAAAPPLPEAWSDGQKYLGYYPDASKRAHEQGHVGVTLHIGPNGAPDVPIQIDRELTDAPPRLQDAAMKILHGIRFAVGNQYKPTLTFSIVFELEPCGTVNQNLTTDYRMSLCMDPSPYNAARLAAFPPTDFEQSTKKILIHGDLADIDFLEETLGLRFRVTPPVPSLDADAEDRGLRIYVTPTFIPFTIEVMGPSYESSSLANGNTRFDLSFGPAECPDIALWAARWKIPATSSTDPHGYGTGVAFKWNGDHGIGVSVFHHASGSCQMSLSQVKTSAANPTHHTQTAI